MCDVAIGQGVTVDRSHMGKGGGSDIRWCSGPLFFHHLDHKDNHLCHQNEVKLLADITMPRYPWNSLKLLAPSATL